VALSPDDKRLAVSRFASQRGSRDIWLYDLLRGTSSRLTFGSGAEVNPLWSPDGSRIVFGSDVEGVYDLYQKPATGSAREELLLRTSQPKYADDWSPDGRHIVFDSLDPDNSSDLWVLGMTGEQKPAPFLRTNADEREARFSPDGRWLAYASDESGRPEVYVQSFPASGGKWQVSSRGGSLPCWRRDGKELYYISLDQNVMAASVRPAETFEHDPPAALFGAQSIALFGYHNAYTCTADGQRFYFSARQTEAVSSPIRLVLNWTSQLPK
jgi:Tol biopolymer transport system component